MSDHFMSKDEVEDRERARYQARVAKDQEEASQAADRQEKKLLKMLEAEDAKGKVDPPPELSPSERKERELVERLDRLEGNQDLLTRPPADRYSSGFPTPEQHRLTEALRILRASRDGERRKQAERELGVADRRKKWEDEQAQLFAEKNAALIAEDERHHAAAQAIHERAKAKEDAAEQACERDVAAKVEKAKPEARQLLGVK